MSTINKALYYILSRKYEFCCLCFETVQDNAVNVYDEVVLRTKISESHVKLTEVLSALLGNQIYSYISNFDTLCDKCMKTAINSYKFINSAKENSVQLSNTLDLLLNSFNDTPQKLEESHSLFISIDTENCKSKQIFDCKYLIKPSPAAGLNRFKSIIETNETTTLEEIPQKIEQDYKDCNMKKKNLRHKFKSKESNLLVPIPTSEMLYDKYNKSNLKCKGCFKDFPSRSNLRNHYIRVHAPKMFKCSTCHRKFGSRSLLEAHEKESHCTLVCTECGKTFHNRHTLKMHEVGHEGIKLVCQDCGRIYKSHSTFKKHIELNVCGQKTRANPAQAKFTCDYCNKKYTQKVSLRVHIQHEHGNYKSHECKWCKKKFWAQSRLKAHIVKHTQEKNFHCNICGGKFVTKESLLYHTRTHTGERPYKCDHCERRFLSASRRADHVKSRHLNATFECDICHSKFKTQLCLQNHKKNHAQVPDVNRGVNLIRQAFSSEFSVQLAGDDKIYLEVSDNCEDYCIGMAEYE